MGSRGEHVRQWVGGAAVGEAGAVGSTLGRGSSSANGTTWTLIGTQTLSGLAATVQVGLAVTSHNEDNATTATFTDVTVSVSTPGPGNQPPVAAVSVSPLSGVGAVDGAGVGGRVVGSGGWGVDVCVVDQ